MRNSMEIGDQLERITRTVDSKNIHLYAQASGDFNPIHIDKEFGEASQFGNNIAHGMMVASLISEMMTRNFGYAWYINGTMRIRFRAPVFPKDQITVTGEVAGIDDSKERKLTCSVSVKRQNNEVAISGKTTVSLLPRAQSEDF